MGPVFFLLLLATGFGTGVLGAMAGIGGGVVLVPLLHLGLGLPVRSAVGVSLVAVLATSSMAAGLYLREGLPLVRLGLALQSVATLCALGASAVAVRVPPQAITTVLAVVLVITAGLVSLRLWLAPGGSRGPEVTARRLRGRIMGLLAAAVAGAASGFLGIGGGVVQVPLLHLGMGLPVRVATATSAYMVGLTAVASSAVYRTHGLLDPMLAAPAALGVLGGALAGARLASRADQRLLERLVAALLIVLAVQLVRRVAAAGGP